MSVKEVIAETGKPAPDFCLPNQDGKETCLKDFRGQWVVLYFYPRDNTPGCTQEACDFTNYLGEFEQLNATVIGISPDSVESHRKFVDKHHLRITLLSDVQHEVLEKYGVWKQKKMYGKTYMGVERSTFIIDPNGVIVHEWRRVRVKGHVQKVAEQLQMLQKDR